MKNQRKHARHRVGLILALVGLISAVALMSGPTRLASAQTAPSWSYTGNLNAARSYVPATLLPNGKVLVAGGSFDSPYTGDLTAELYDPATGTWSATGSAASNFGTGAESAGFFNHTATLLPNGKVLVAGGSEFDGSFKSAELYDPATGTWSYTSTPNTARESHTATLLPNGKVLIAAGFDYDYNSLNTAELYDPATGTWSRTGNLNVSRVYHTATLLPNGKVLVEGGVEENILRPSEALSSAELYDPATGTWSNTGSLNTARVYHTATLLPNGKVLVAAGSGAFFPNGLNSAELYDPATGTWTSTGNLNTERDSRTAMLLPSGKVLLVGNDIAELYDPATGTWSITASPKKALIGPATLLPNGTVLMLASYDNTAELYDPGTSAMPNLIDNAQFFVRQHYRDFLNREPDTDGLNFWTAEILSCGTDAQCVEAKRINISAAYFLSIEFQQTGYLVYRLYKSSYGNLPSVPVPLTLNEFLPDSQKIGRDVIVNQSGWEQVLENNKQSFTSEFVQRSRFTSAFLTSMTPTQFVDRLFTNAGVTPSATDRQAAIGEFGSATSTSDVAARARTLRRVAENPTMNIKEFNRAFVLMQYFGYLRRNPNDAPDSDYSGYQFWLAKLNVFDGNFVNAEMVKAFITSTEYRQRFGP